MKLLILISCILVLSHSFSLFSMFNSALSIFTDPRGRKRVFLRDENKDNNEKKVSSSENSSENESESSESGNCTNSSESSGEENNDEEKKMKFVKKYDKMFNSTLNETRIKMFFLNLTHTRFISEFYENFELGSKIKKTDDYGKFESRIKTLLYSFYNDEKISLYMIPRNFKALHTINKDLSAAREELLKTMENETVSRKEGDSNEIFELFRFNNAKKRMLGDVLNEISNETFWQDRNVTNFIDKFSKQITRYFNWNFRTQVLDGSNNIKVNFDVPPYMIFQEYSRVEVYKCCNHYINSMNMTLGNESFNINDGYWAMNDTSKEDYETQLLSMLDKYPDNKTVFSDFDFPENMSRRGVSEKTLLGKMIENKNVLEGHHIEEDKEYKEKVKVIKEYIANFTTEENQISSQLLEYIGTTETTSSKSKKSDNEASKDKKEGSDSNTDGSNSSNSKKSNSATSSSASSASKDSSKSSERNSASEEIQKTSKTKESKETSTESEKTTKVSNTTTTTLTETKGIKSKYPDKNRIDQYGEVLKGKIEEESEHCLKDWEAAVEKTGVRAENIMNQREAEFKNLNEWYEMEYGDIKGKKNKATFSRIEKEEAERKTKRVKEMKQKEDEEKRKRELEKEKEKERQREKEKLNKDKGGKGDNNGNGNGSGNGDGSGNGNGDGKGNGNGLGMGGITGIFEGGNNLLHPVSNFEVPLNQRKRSKSSRRRRMRRRRR